MSIVQSGASDISSLVMDEPLITSARNKDSEFHSYDRLQFQNCKAGIWNWIYRKADFQKIAVEEAKGWRATCCSIPPLPEIEISGVQRVEKSGSRYN